MSVTYNPALPWGGYGSPCGDLRLQRWRGEAHAADPRCLPPVDVGFAELADCVECDMCGGCYAHEGCAADWNHIAWFARFASPGEPACGITILRTGRSCALPAGHGGEWHQDHRGNGLPNTANLPKRKG